MSATVRSITDERAAAVWPALARGVIVLALVAGAAAGLVLGAGAGAGVSATEADLVRLLRGMAMLKLLFVAAAAASILWRLQRPVSPAMLLGYAASSAAMAAGPGLIWYLAHLGAASILLHGGVAAAVVLLWRDRAVGELLGAAIERRRAALRTR